MEYSKTRLLILLCSISICCSQLDGSFWWLPKESTIAPSDSTTELSNHHSSSDSGLKVRYSVASGVVCCECVPFYLCENGSIITDGFGALDVRIGGEKTTTPAPAVNVEVCPDVTKICCQVPNVDPSCLHQTSETPVTENPGYIFTPHPDSDCECREYTDCNAYLVVSNGLGITSLELSDGRVVSHSKCYHSLDVCCFLPGIYTGNETDLVSSSTTPVTSDRVEPVCECVPPVLCGADGFINTDGAGVLDLRIGPSKPPTPCPQNPNLVCCLPPKSEDEITTESSISPPSSTLPQTDLTPSTTSPLITNPSEPICECVPPFLCGSDGYIKTDGAGGIDVRIGPSKPPKTCPHDPTLVCCLPPISDQGSQTETPSPKPPIIPPCGQRNFNGIGVRILGFQDDQTQFGEFPWVATLLKNEYLTDSVHPLFVGGGSLIHERVVLTAAHKVRGIPVGDLMIRLGEWDVASNKESLPHQDVGVEKVIIHPKFTPGPLFHDVALLILKEKANIAYHIAPICPAKSLDDVDPSSCVINGWGVDAYRSSNYQNIMKSIQLPLVDKDTCEKQLKKTRLSRYFRLHNSFICAGGEEGLDACKNHHHPSFLFHWNISENQETLTFKLPQGGAVLQLKLFESHPDPNVRVYRGDGGGPLTCKRRDDPSRYLQVGITAWGIGCGEKDVPGVYADVTVDYSWIMDEIKSYFPLENLSTTTEVHYTSSSSTTERALTSKERRKLRKQQRKEERRKAREERRRRRLEEKGN